MQEVTGSIPVVSTNKNRTFVYWQMFCFCLSKPQAWHIIAARSAVHIISPFGAVYHHALACIFPAAWWYPDLRSDDIPQQVADDIHAFGVMGTRKRVDKPFLLCYTEINNTKGGKYMKKVNIIPLVAFLCLVLSCIIGFFDLCIELPLAFSVCNLLLVITACVLLLIFVIKQKKGKK